MKRYTLYLDYAEVATPSPRKRALGEYETATGLKNALETARPREGGGRLWALDRGPDPERARNRGTVLEVADIMLL